MGRRYYLGVDKSKLLYIWEVVKFPTFSIYSYLVMEFNY